MVVTTAAYKTAIKQYGRVIKCKAIFTSLGFTAVDEILKLEMDSNLVGGEDFEIGTAYMDTAKLELTEDEWDGIYLNYAFEGQEADLQVGIKLPDTTIEYHSVGLFTVEKADRNEGLVTLELVDRMAKADKEYTLDIAFPATLAQIMQSAATQAGLTLTSTSFANSTYEVSIAPVFEGITCRQIFAQIAELAGGYAKINRSGSLSIMTLSNTAQTSITRDNVNECKVAEGNTGTIDKVIVKVGAEQAVSGTGDNLYTIVDNMFVQNPSDVVDAIFSVLATYSYKPIVSMDWVGDFSLEVGDRIEYEAQGTYILSRKLRCAGGLSEVYKAPVKSNTERNSTGKNNTNLEIGRLKTTIRIINGEIAQTIDEIANFQDRYNTDAETQNAKIAQNTSNISQNATEISKKVSQTVYDADMKIVSESFTEVDQRMDGIESTIQVGGGSNLIKNSVGYGDLNFWTLLSGSVGYDVSTWILDGIAKHGWRISTGVMDQEIDLIAGKDYALSGKLHKYTSAGTAIVKLLNPEDDSLVYTAFQVATPDLYNGEFSFAFNSGVYKKLKLVIDVAAASTTDPVEITDLLLAQGQNLDVWSQAAGENYTLLVKMDGKGIKVYRQDGTGYTIMDPNEFAGYYNNTKIFTLNGDITEVMGLDIGSKGLFIRPIKMVQTATSLDIVWTGW